MVAGHQRPSRRRALDFLPDNPDRPCFVNLWLDDRHTPGCLVSDDDPDDQKVGKSGRATGKGDNPERLAKVLTEMDRQVGRLLAALWERKGGRPTMARC
jgi:hypothetical protein